jgi:hypothetical protein
MNERFYRNDFEVQNLKKDEKQKILERWKAEIKYKNRSWWKVIKKIEESAKKEKKETKKSMYL